MGEYPTGFVTLHLRTAGNVPQNRTLPAFFPVFAGVVPVSGTLPALSGAFTGHLRLPQHRPGPILAGRHFYEVWETRFDAFRKRDWTRTGRCKDCKAWRDCLGNGMHNSHNGTGEVLQCHYAKTLAEEA